MLRIEIAPGIWQLSENLIPYSNNLKLDESLDNAVVEIIVDSKEPLPSLTKVQLIDTSRRFDYVVKNCTSIKIGNRYLQVLELIEPTEMLKGIEIDTLMITQPLKPDFRHPRLKLIDVLDKILAVTPTVTLARENETLKHKFEIDPVIREKFSKIESPEFSFPEYMLYDALVDIGMYVDMFPRLKFGNYDSNGKLMITFDNLDVKEKENYVVEGYNDYEAQQPLENYANEVVSNVKNLSVDSIVVYPANGLGVYPNAPYGTIDITDSNARITLPDRIKKIIKFEAFLGSIYHDDFTEYECIEFREWQTRIPDTPASRVPYYRYNDYHILNLREWHNQLPGGGSEPKPSLRSTLFRITYIPYMDTEVSEKNEGTIDFTVVYNQTSNIVEQSTYSNHLKNYIKRMANGDVVISKVYKNLSSIPTQGHMVNGYILTNLSYIKHYDRYDVTMQLSKNYTRRAEFIRAKNEIRTWEITVDGKVEDRLVVYSETFNVSVAASISEQVEPKGLLKFERLFHYLLGTERNSDGIIAVINFKTVDGTTIPTMLVPYTTSFGSKILIEFKAIDNTLLGYNKSLNWADEVRSQIGVTYTDEYGNFETVDIGFSDQFRNIINSEAFARNYPTSTISQNNNLFNTCFFKINDLNVKKDSRERFGFSYQLKVVGVNNTIVCENFVKYAFEKNVESYKVILLNKTLRDNEEIKSENILATRTVSSTLLESESVTYTYYEVSQTDVKAAVLIATINDKDKPLIILNNPNTEQLNEIKNGNYKVYFK